MKAGQDSSHTLIINAKSAKFIKDTDWFGKMDPYVTIKVDKDSQRTETAMDQGKTPKWTMPLTFKITPEKYNTADLVDIVFEAYDEDGGKKAELLGSVTFKLSQIKVKPNQSTTLTLLNAKGEQAGTLDVDWEFKVVESLINPQQKNPENQGSSASRLTGTVVVRPGGGKFEVGGVSKQTLKLSFQHYGITCETGISERPDSRLVFQNPIIFQLYEGQEISVKCIDNDPKKPGVIGEGQIDLAGLIKRGNLHDVPVKMNSRVQKLGDLNLEVEFLGEVFENPVKIFPPLLVKKGESVHKKVKYANLDKVPKKIKIKSQNKNLVTVKTETLTIPPNQVVEIKFEVFGPVNQKAPQEKCRIDVVLEDTRIVEESMLFSITSVNNS